MYVCIGKQKVDDLDTFICSFRKSFSISKYAGYGRDSENQFAVSFILVLQYFNSFQFFTNFRLMALLLYPSFNFVTQFPAISHLNPFLLAPL